MSDQKMKPWPPEPMKYSAVDEYFLAHMLSDGDKVAAAELLDKWQKEQQQRIAASAPKMHSSLLPFIWPESEKAADTVSQLMNDQLIYGFSALDGNGDRIDPTTIHIDASSI